jgi:hypothetical protein
VTSLCLLSIRSIGSEMWRCALDSSVTFWGPVLENPDIPLAPNVKLCGRFIPLLSTSGASNTRRGSAIPEHTESKPDFRHSTVCAWLPRVKMSLRAPTDSLGLSATLSDGFHCLHPTYAEDPGILESAGRVLYSLPGTR